MMRQLGTNASVGWMTSKRADYLPSASEPHSYEAL